MNYPVFVPIDSLSEYCIQINSSRISIRCSENSDWSPEFKYTFSSTSSGALIQEPEYTGEIVPMMGVVDLPSKQLGNFFPTWRSAVRLEVWPKSDASMETGDWGTDKDVRRNVLKMFHKDLDAFSDWSDFYTPSLSSDVDVIKISGLLWAYTSSGSFKHTDMFCASLGSDLLLKIIFDSSSCWHRKGYAPEPVKQHLMKFYLDYLSHVKIIPVGSVPDTDLPPLGFYPAEREEKAIDAEGRVVESQSDSDSSETTMGW